MTASPANKVVEFRQGCYQSPPIWRHDELQALLALHAACVAGGEASSWETGTTEQGDPQFYINGPAPEFECIICVSRLGRLFVLEDRVGTVVGESTDLQRIVELASASLRKRSRSGIGTRVFCAFCAFRMTIEQKVEAFMAESGEHLTHYAPGLAALI
jgi:hypothetical protein